MKFRITFYDYQNDFDGYHSFNCIRNGYVTKNDILRINGWVLPNNGDKTSILKYQIISNGTVKAETVLPFLESTDVYEHFREHKGSNNARYSVELPLTFLDHSTPHVVRFMLENSSINNTKIFDIAYTVDLCTIKPIFVLGSPRAGTTVIGNAIRSSLKAKNYGEHHFAFLINKVEEAIELYFSTYHTRKDKGTFINDVSPALVIANIQQSFKQIYNEMHGGDDFFVDNTPGRNMLKSVQRILNIWPEAKIIYCKRRAIENIASRLIKFPTVSFEDHCRQWLETTNIWNELKRFLPVHSFIEIEHYDVANRPDIISKEIENFLSINVSNDIHSILSSSSPQSTGNDFRLAKCLDNLNWTNEQKDLFWKICGSRMLFEGYTVDEDYYQDKDVIKGRSGKLYIGNGTNSFIRQLNKEINFNPQKKESWLSFLSNLKECAHKHKFHLCFLISPESHLVFPNDLGLPEQLTTDALLSVIQILKELNIDLTFPLEALKDANNSDLNIWYHSDSHWNHQGAYIAYLELCKTLNIPSHPVKDSDFIKNLHIGDLEIKYNSNTNGRIELYLSNEYFNRNIKSSFNNKVPNRGNICCLTGRAPLTNSKCLLLRDSYGAHLMPFLAKSMGHLLALHTNEVSIDLIEKYNPDYLVFEIASRFLFTPPCHLNIDIDYADYFQKLGKGNSKKFKDELNHLINYSK